MELFITKLFEEPAFYLSTVISFAGSICVHEYCHAFVAHHLGDDMGWEGGSACFFRFCPKGMNLKKYPAREWQNAKEEVFYQKLPQR